RTRARPARQCRLAPADVRRRNLIRADEFPYKTPSGFVYDSGQYEAALDRVLTLVDYKSFRKLQRVRRAEHHWLGIGFSSFVETAGVGPSKTTHIIGWESGGGRGEPSGKVPGITGASPHGQGLEAALAQITGRPRRLPAGAG